MEVELCCHPQVRGGTARQQLNVWRNNTSRMSWKPPERFCRGPPRERPNNDVIGKTTMFMPEIIQQSCEFSEMNVNVYVYRFLFILRRLEERLEVPGSH